jgi:mannosyltransferase
MIHTPGRDSLRRVMEYPLFGLITGAAVIRLIGISTRGIQYDDAFSILLANRKMSEIILGTAADTMPPLYYFILHYWQYLGTSIAFQRIPGILFSLGIIAIMYRIVLQMVGKQAAIWTAAILAVSPLEYYHAQDLRMYSLVTFFVLIWDWRVLQLIQMEKPRNLPVWKWLVIILSGAGALYSHALAVFGLLVPLIYLLIKRDWIRLKFFAIAGFLVVLLFLPWLINIPGQIAKVQQAFWTPVPGVVEIIQSIAMTLGDIPLPPLLLGLVIFCCLNVAIICFMVYYRTRKDRGQVQFFILMALIPPAILFLLSYAMRPMFVPRAFLSAYVGVSALIGIAADRARRLEKILIAGFVFLAAIITLPNQVAFNEFPRSPFQQAASYLSETVKEKDIVLHDNKLSSFPFKVYAPNLINRFLADQPGSANDTLAEQTQSALDISPYSDLMSAIQGSHRVFFVVFQQTIKDYTSAGGHPIIQKLDEVAGKPIEHLFSDLVVLEFLFQQEQP